MTVGLDYLSSFLDKTTQVQENEGLGGFILPFWVLGARKQGLGLKNLNGGMFMSNEGMSG